MPNAKARSSRAATNMIWILMVAGALGCKGKATTDEGGKAETASAKPAETGFEQENKPDNLVQFLEAITDSLDAQDPKAITMIQSLVPDEAAVKAVLRDGVPAETVARLVAGAKKSLEIIGSGFTQTEMHFATAKEIAEQQTPESGHFSGHDVDAARDLLRPEVTFYRVHFTKPSGLDDKTFNLCFWDGKQWRSLGRVMAGE